MKKIEIKNYITILTNEETKIIKDEIIEKAIIYYKKAIFDEEKKEICIKIYTVYKEYRTLLDITVGYINRTVLDRDTADEIINSLDNLRFIIDLIEILFKGEIE